MRSVYGWGGSKSRQRSMIDVRCVLSMVGVSPKCGFSAAIEKFGHGLLHAGPIND